MIWPRFPRSVRLRSVYLAVGCVVAGSSRGCRLLGLLVLVVLGSHNSFLGPRTSNLWCPVQDLACCISRHSRYLAHRIARAQATPFDGVLSSLARLAARDPSRRVAASTESEADSDMDGRVPGKSTQDSAMGMNIQIVVEPPQRVTSGSAGTGLSVSEPVLDRYKMSQIHQLPSVFSYSCPQLQPTQLEFDRCLSEPKSDAALDTEYFKTRWRNPLLSRQSTDSMMDALPQSEKREPQEESSIESMPVPVFLMSCVQPGGYFDGKVLRVKAAHHRSHAASVLFSR